MYKDLGFKLIGGNPQLSSQPSSGLYKLVCKVVRLLLDRDISPLAEELAKGISSTMEIVPVVLESIEAVSDYIKENQEDLTFLEADEQLADISLLGVDKADDEVVIKLIIRSKSGKEVGVEL